MRSLVARGGVYRRAPWWPLYERRVRYVAPPPPSPGDALGDLATVTVSAPGAGATGAGAASGGGATVTVSALSGGATGLAEATGALDTVTVVPPTASATGGAGGAAVGALPSVVVDAPLAGATGAAVTSGALPVLVISAPAATASSGAPTTGTGWRLTFRTVGYRWRLAWRSMTPNVPFPIPIAGDNDAGVLLEEIAGYEVPSGAPMVYDGTSLTAYWSASPAGTTPLGSISTTFPRNAVPPRFTVSFEAGQMTTALAGLLDGTPVWLILEGAGNFRVAIEHIVRAARVVP